ncbi:hypothetical protein AB0M58_14145 [Streptomyces bobili]|uniref:hypothetical protein n=1 Tax=Streptomyces bobili TaxID=67280 RepID=UPI0034318CB9
MARPSSNRPQTRGGKTAAKKAAAPTPSKSEATVLDEARAKADGIIAEAEELATAKITAAAEEAEQTVEQLRIRAEETALQLLDDARAEAEAVRADAAERLAHVTNEADRLRAESAENADRLLAEAKTRAEETTERARAEADALLDKARTEAARLRGEAEQALARGREDAERIRSDATAEADRLRAAGAADRERAQDEAASIRAEAERVRQHAQDTAEALRTQAEQTAARVRDAATAEAVQVRQDAAEDADRTRRTAEDEANRQRAGARTAVAEAEKLADQLVSQAHEEAAGIVDRAENQVRVLTAQVESALGEAKATRAEAVAEADDLRKKTQVDREKAAEELARALNPTVLKLEKRKLMDEADEQRLTKKRNAKEQLAEHKRQRREARKTGKPTLADKSRSVLLATGVRVLIIVPIIAPMVVAWTGQSGFAIKVLGWNFAASLVYAAAYEMTTAYCAWLYDQARRDGDKGWEYRIATWLFGIGAAVQQWWHYSHDWSATPRAVTFSAMSMVGVVLWELFARLVHRRKLRKDKNLPPALPSLGMARWTRYPVRTWTARSLMIDNPVRWANSEDTWVQAGRKLADRKARRSGKAYADLYLVTVHRSSPDHGPDSIPAVHTFMDRADRTVLDRMDHTDRTAADRTALPAGGPDRTKELDRGPDRTVTDRTALPAAGPDRTAIAADRPNGPDHKENSASTSTDHGPGSSRTAEEDRETPAADRTPPDRTADGRLADGPPYTAPDGFKLTETEQRAIDVLRSTDRSITKRNIAEVIRSEGGSIGSDRAAEVARHFPRNLRSA